ncbi:MAG: hypothetical protein ABFS35_04650 [Bacteroidota bacterium]
MNKFKLGLFFTNIENNYNKAAASTWIRIMQMIEHYEALGVEVSINNYFKRYDAAIIYRKSKKKYYWMLRIAKLISKKVYFDTCINIFDLHSEINNTRLKYAFKIAKHADGFICASNQIAHLAEAHCQSVCTFEDSINLNHFKYTKDSINFDTPVFGWSGTSDKAYFLNKYADEIDKRIILITNESILKEKCNFEYDFIKWEYNSFPENLLNCDIALLPRVYKDSYNSGHSSFKALVFAVCGIPIIANKVPSYVDLAKYYDGIVFLEDNNDSIHKCIEVLKEKDLDTSNLKEYYSCKNQASLLINYLKDMNIN